MGPTQTNEGRGKSQKKLAPQVGLEPTTLRLTAGCSAIELLRSVVMQNCPIHNNIRIPA